MASNESYMDDQSEAQAGVTALWTGQDLPLAWDLGPSPSVSPWSSWYRERESTRTTNSPGTPSHQGLKEQPTLASWTNLSSTLQQAAVTKFEPLAQETNLFLQGHDDLPMASDVVSHLSVMGAPSSYGNEQGDVASEGEVLQWWSSLADDVKADLEEDMAKVAGSWQGTEPCGDPKEIFATNLAAEMGREHVTGALKSAASQGFLAPSSSPPSSSVSPLPEQCLPSSDPAVSSESRPSEAATRAELLASAGISKPRAVTSPQATREASTGPIRKTPAERIAIACSRCKQRKMKCDGGQPRCSCCAKAGIDTCSYAEVVRKRGRAKKTILAELENAKAELEAQRLTGRRDIEALQASVVKLEEEFGGR